MPPATKKRKTAKKVEKVDDPDVEAPQESEPIATMEVNVNAESKDTQATTSPVPDEKAADRLARFKALQARAKSSAQTNLKEATLESQRMGTDPALLASLARKSAVAQHKLLKADAEASGEDFERKRAWDWTIDESEKWDKRLKKKGAHRDNQAFQDYRQDSQKVYKRQIRDLKPDMEGYEKAKMAAVERAAATGGLEVVETDDGELVAVDKEGTFYSSAQSMGFVEHRPEKAAVDRLVKDLQQAEETRLKKRRDRLAQNGEDGDVTFINEKNKHFNQKLARFYDKVSRRSNPFARVLICDSTPPKFGTALSVGP